MARTLRPGYRPRTGPKATLSSEPEEARSAPHLSRAASRRCTHPPLNQVSKFRCYAGNLHQVSYALARSRKFEARDPALDGRSASALRSVDRDHSVTLRLWHLLPRVADLRDADASARGLEHRFERPVLLRGANARGPGRREPA